MGWLIGHNSWKKPVRDGYEPMPYALDNGMFFPHGGTPHGSDRLCEFFGRVGKALAFHAPVFAVVPDMPYDWPRTMKLWEVWIKRCRDLAPEWRWGIAVQNGATPTDLDRMGISRRPELSAVCVGGDSEWKDKTIRKWATWCRERGIWCHVLRVNGESRLRVCQDEEVGSVDGTGLFPWRPETAPSGNVGVEPTMPVSMSEPTTSTANAAGGAK